MLSSRPYLVRALFEWIVDNEWTPHILVDAGVDGVDVPESSINEEGRVVLNIGPAAVEDLSLENDWVSFHARFGGISQSVFVPTNAVIGIYARENGKGMVFNDEDGGGPDAPPPEPPSKKKPESTPAPKKPTLKIVR